jgi:hypothetical protein
MSPFCKWSCSHLILRSTCLVLEFPGLVLFVHIAIVERLSSNMLTPCCGDPMFSNILIVWRTDLTQLTKLSSSTSVVERAIADGTLSVALPDNRSTVAKNQVSLLTFPCKSIICKTYITHRMYPVSQFRICWYFVADVEVGCTHYVSHNSVCYPDKLVCRSCHVLSQYGNMVGHVKPQC